MINGWRRAFCTSIPKERSDDGVVDDSPVNTQHKSISRFNFFSNPSTPRSNSGTYSLRCRTSAATAAIPPSPSPSPSPSLSSTPKLQCRTTAETTTPTRSASLVSLLTPLSPKSPASFSLLKSKLRFNRSSNRCGICLQSAKTGQGTAIFTAECSHTFHFPCVTSRASDDRKLLASCPICGASWREYSLDIQNYAKSELKIRESKNKSLLRVYNDDEPLISSPISPAGFHTILESDENDEELVNGEFRGFSVNTPSSLTAKRLTDSKNVDVKLSPEAAIVAVGKGYETYSVVVKVKSPPFPTTVKRGRILRAPVDLVTVLDVTGTENIETVKRAMNLVISSLRETDRLSIIAFSSTSKRLSPLRRMTVNGRRSARRIVEIITVAGSGGGNAGEGITVNDAVKKAVKVIDDRRQKNLFATVFVLTDRNNVQAHQAQSAHSKFVSSTRFSRSEIPVHTIWLGACKHALTEDIVNGCLSLTVQDLSIQLGLVSSDQGEITSVYSISGKPVWLGTGLIRLGDMYAEEERALLVEIKSTIGGRPRRIMTVRSRYVDPTTQEITNSEDRTVQIPRPLTVRSSNPNISRLRNLHVSTRAVAESQRLIERNQYSAAQRLLTSARAFLVQYDSNDACLRGIDAELMDLNRLRGRHVASSESLDSPRVYNKEEPLTPTSAWKTAEKLAKVAMMRKHMNRVSDLHGFENARF